MDGIQMTLLTLFAKACVSIDVVQQGILMGERVNFNQSDELKDKLCFQTEVYILAMI
jgi:hypothetical protein